MEKTILIVKLKEQQKELVNEKNSCYIYDYFNYVVNRM